MAEFKELPAGAPVMAQLTNWFENRFPTAFAEYKKHMSEYYAPKNFNFWYFFGSLAMLVLAMQIVTGIFLTMHYKPDAALAFASVEYIMRDVPGGWLIRYMHSTGASAFFAVVYLHMWRGMIYGSYRKPRELVWIFGVAIFLCLMGEAFMGYLLPWGQMSYWGAQVIINLFAAIPFVGPDLALLIRGDYVVGDATLNRFFAFHVIAIPLVLIGLVVAHLLVLHDVGSNNPDGVEIKAKKDPATGIPLDGVAFHPYYTIHDVLGVSVFLMIFCAIMFFAPELGGYFLEFNNFIPADPLQTPAHIAPVWYFTPFYSMLRATTSNLMPFLWLGLVLIGLFMIARSKLPALVKSGYWGLMALLFFLFGVPAIALGWMGIDPGMRVLAGFDPKFWGVVLMGAGVIILFFLPWLDASPVKSIRYRPGWHKAVYGLFVAFFLILGWLGVEPPSELKTLLAQIGTVYYFGFFLLMPWWSRLGEFKPVPERVVFQPH
jgi:ubiquinol-cytochrome c reductase cytochrome b subunit